MAFVPLVLSALTGAVPAGFLAAKLASRYAEPADRLPASLVLGLNAAIFVSAALARLPMPVLWCSLGLGWTLACLAVIDLTAFRLPDAFTLPLIAVGLAVSFVLLPGRPIVDHLVGAAVGYGALAGLAWAFEKARGIDGIGMGDAKLLAAAGAWLGWRDLPSVVLIACALAFVWVAVSALARGRDVLGRRIAFGAPLCLAFWIVWLRGPLPL